ncbi:MAG: site-specific DNA-methyltransferase [Chloroflexi bacterium]|nr:site-specific DNA-methyltransferase [Chloroflexota bacterium]
MVRLSEEEIKFITRCLKEGKQLPDSYRHIIPFETKKEYELTYADKEREEDILADTMGVPLQPVKTFGNNGDGWTNKLIFGDNLQVLKTLMNDPEVKGRVRLIYIDPPFGTGDVYNARGEAPAYSAKLQGAKFIEFLRKRLVFLREILAADGSIYVRTDYHFGHYLKAIMDEVFGKNNFRNEIVVSRGRNIAGAREKMEVDNDLILWYSRSSNFVFREVKVRRPVSEIKWTSFLMAGDRHPRERVFLGKTLSPPAGQHFALIQSTVDRLLREFYLRLRCRSCGARYYQAKSNHGLFRRMKQKEHRFKFYDVTTETYVHGVENLENCLTCRNGNFVVEYLGASERKISNIWLDIESYSRSTGFPTENSEELLERIIELSSNKADEGDIVLDAFAGSGTTGAVAEKLGRRWIMIDCGKLAVYTMQKRLLNLKEEIGNKGKPLKPKPFTLYNAGLYDYRMIKKLPWEEYRSFVLKLFQCRDEKHRIAGVELDGYLGADDVLVFDYKKHKDAVLDRGFIDDLHSILGDRIGRRFFVIAPAASVMFLEDYIEKGNTRYFVLRIPYSIIDELHRKGFTHIKQPVSEMDVNDTVDAVGFDFIQIPEVDCEYYLDKPRGQASLGHSSKDAVIKITRFESNIISKKPLHFQNFETLSMVMVDYNYDGEVFNFDDVFYAEDLKKQGYEIHFDSSKLNGQMMLIYIDIFGNEKREVKIQKDFNRRKRESI